MLDVDQLPELDTLLFYNFGEPFLHKDAIQFLRTVKQQRPYLHRHEHNGFLVFTSTRSRRWRRGLINKIVFRSMEPTGELSDLPCQRRSSKALSNMKTLIDASKAAGPTRGSNSIAVHSLSGTTREELAHAKQLAREIGVPIKWMLTHTACFTTNLPAHQSSNVSVKAKLPFTPCRWSA
jgi:hypothetical protein